MKFLTGSETIPPDLFPERITIHFKHDLAEYRKPLQYWKPPDGICATAYSIFYLCTLTQNLDVIYEKNALVTPHIEQSFKPLADTLTIRVLSLPKCLAIR